MARNKYNQKSYGRKVAVGWRPRIRSVLLVVNLVILLMPLIGIQALNLYQNELVQRTETALISQGTVIRELFTSELLRNVQQAKVDLRQGDYGLPVLVENPEVGKAMGRYRPIFASLTMNHSPIYGEAEEAEPALLAPDPIAILAAERVEPIIQRAQLNNLAGIRLIDFRGVVVGSTGSETGLSLLKRAEVRRVLTGEEVMLMRRRSPGPGRISLSTISRGTRVRVWVALPAIARGRVLGAVILARTPLDLQKALYNNRFILMRYGIALLLIVVIVTVLTSTTISRPARALIDQTTQVKDDPRKATVPIDRPGSRELFLLSNSIAEMAATLQNRAKYIEEFARNVSHEFKTPLASIQGTVELLEDHLDGMDEGERRKFLEMLRRDAARMQQLVERLLHLARADVLKPGDETLEVAPALEAIVSTYRERSIDIQVHGLEIGQGKHVRMSREVLTSILMNLIDNSIHHGGPNVAIQIGFLKAADVGRHGTWRGKDVRAKEYLSMFLQDSGPGISDGNLHKVFEPFFTTSRDTGGTGLGLSIVKALADAHDATINFEPLERGLRVRLDLPVVDDMVQ